MLGENAVRAYHLDADALAAVAARIAAPTLAELAVPVTTVPEGGGVLAFRSVGPWA
jgi:hypothetical protein